MPVLLAWQVLERAGGLLQNHKIEVTMKLERITRDDLRAIHEGESRTYDLPNYEAIQSARSTAYILGRIEGCRFAFATEPDSNRVTITRMPR